MASLDGEFLRIAKLVEEHRMQEVERQFSHAHSEWKDVQITPPLYRSGFQPVNGEPFFAWEDGDTKLRHIKSNSTKL